MFSDIPKPEWLGKREPNNEEEKKAVREYEKKLQVRREERQKHKKALETELKKMYTLIDETCTAFDEKLQQLALQKMKTDMFISQEELRIVKLSASLLKQEETSKLEEECAARLERLKKKKVTMAAIVGDFKEKLDMAQSDYDTKLQDDQRNLATFNSDFQIRGERGGLPCYPKSVQIPP